MSLYATAVKKPVTTALVFVAIVIFGLFSLTRLSVDLLPEIETNTIMVMTSYAGASAADIEMNVSKPLENVLNSVSDLKHITSQSRENISIITLEFDYGTDIDVATNDVRDKLDVAEPMLPDDVDNPIIFKFGTNDIPIIILSVTAEESTNALYKILDDKVSNPLARISGVGAVSISGTPTREIQVYCDPYKLEAYGVSIEGISAIIAQENRNTPGGSVDIGSNAYALRVQGEFTDAHQMDDLVIGHKDNKTIYLRDVARIEDSIEERAQETYNNGKKGGMIVIQKQSGANSVNIAKKVHQKLPEIQKSLPSDVKLGVIMDTSTNILNTIDSLKETIFITFVIVMLVVFVFLGRWRATFIIILTIPISLIASFAYLLASGNTLNIISLSSLSIAIGMVVDDAIVVVENSSRLMDTGKYTAREAVTEAMGEIVGPIVGVVLVLLAVFIPTTFISGISGQLYKQFALTIAAATVLSGFNSLTLTPALCALFLQANKEPKFFVFKAFNKVFGKTQKIYDDIVGRMLKSPLVTMVIFGIITVIAIVMFMRWPTTFIPEEDDGYFLVSTQLPPAASLNRTEAVGKQIDKILDSYPEVKTYIGVNGFSIMGGGELSNAGTYFVILKNWNERKGKKHTASAVVNRFNREAYGIQEAQIFAMVPPAIPGLGASGGLQLQLEDRKNLGPTEMQHAIETLQATYRSKPQLLSLSSMYQANVPQYNLEIDRDKVQLLGLQLNQVFSTLSYYMGAAYVNDFVEFGRIYQVKIEANDQAQKVIDDVLHLSLENNSGKMVPFSAFTEVKEQLGLDQINLYNMYKSASITCIANPKYSSGEAIQAMEELVQEQLGNNFGYEWTSVAYQETKAGSTTMLVFAMALLVAFLVLSAQYESWTSPIAAIMGLPIALLGAILGCFVMGVPVSIYTQIGIILLIALSAKNGILIVEFARDYHKAGNPIRESALEAGHVRLRPILMTSFAFVLGVMPLLFATGAGAGSRLSLGAAVVFGMAINTIFATMFIPSFYELLQLFQEKVLDKFNRKQK